MRYLLCCLLVLMCACGAGPAGPSIDCTPTADSSMIVNAIVILQATGDTLSAEWFICFERHTHLLPQLVVGDSIIG